MSNRAHLCNSRLPIANPYELFRRNQQPGGDYVIVAETSYQAPLPWFCCFRPEDLQEVPLEYEDDYDEDFPESPPTTVLLP